MSACNKMKKSVIMSAVLVLIGTLLEVGSQMVGYGSMATVYLAYAGVGALGLGCMSLLSVFLLIMVPSVHKKLQDCHH